MVRLAGLDGALLVDEDRRIAGRGGYLHRESGCLAKFTRSKIKEFRSLRRGIALDERRRIADRIAELIQSVAG